jgi:hypothetical protein
MTMRMVYGTLGWHVSYLQPAIRRVEDLDQLVFYYGYVDREDAKRKTLATRDKMIEICEMMDLRYDARHLRDPFDFVGIVKRLKKDIDKDLKRKNDITLFNIAGGTKPMCSAALMVCIFKGLPALYVNEETGEPVAIPILEADYLSALTPKDRELAELIIKNRSKDLTIKKIMKISGKKKGTISTQVQRLEEKGILVVESTGGRQKSVRPSEGVELLF